MSEAPFRVSDSPRLAFPQAIVAAIRVLIDELPSLPDYRRNELRTIVRKLCIMYRMPNPYGRANDSEVEQILAEEDGDAVTDEDVSPRR